MTKLAMDYQAKLVTPFALLGIHTEEDWLTGVDYLPLDTSPLAPKNPLAREVCKQLQAYLADPGFAFDLSLHISGTTHQRRVWQAIQEIPCGKTRSYADIATQLHSAPRAVGAGVWRESHPHHHSLSSRYCQKRWPGRLHACE